MYSVTRMNGLTRCPLSCPLSLKSTAMGTSIFCLFMCCQRLMKVVLQCQNQEALRSALRRPATSQNNAGSKTPHSPRSLFRQITLRYMPRARATHHGRDARRTCRREHRACLCSVLHCTCSMWISSRQCQPCRQYRHGTPHEGQLLHKLFKNL